MNVQAYLVEVGSLSRRSRQHAADQVAQVPAVLDVDRWVPPLPHALSEPVEAESSWYNVLVMLGSDPYELEAELFLRLAFPRQIKRSLHGRVHARRLAEMISLRR